MKHRSRTYRRNRRRPPVVPPLEYWPYRTGTDPQDSADQHESFTVHAIVISALFTAAMILILLKALVFI